MVPTLTSRQPKKKSSLLFENTWLFHKFSLHSVNNNSPLKAGAMKFLGWSRWELKLTLNSLTKFNSHLDQPRNFIAPALNCCTTTQEKMKHFINLRTYTHPNPWKGKDQKEHSYYVGHEIGGLSDVAETITIDESNNFVTIREIIEEQRDENIMRRRRFYYEFIQLMQRCPNVLMWEGASCRDAQRVADPR